MLLNRRGFMMTSFASGTATALSACDAFTPPSEPADGTYQRPFTREDPGPWQEKIEIHQPVVYGSLVDANRVRLWTEVRDVQSDKNHEMTSEHFVTRLLLQDQFYNTIEDRTFTYDAEARLVATVEIPPEVTSIFAFEQCNLHGWWRSSYDVVTLRQAPVGDTRRAFTAAQPGQFGGQVATHTPLLGRRPNGDFAVEVGDRANGGLHPQQANHHIQHILVYDQYDQLREVASLGPNYPEPVFDFPPVGGTSRIRVLAYCNNYNWWEAEFSIT